MFGYARVAAKSAHPAARTALYRAIGHWRGRGQEGAGAVGGAVGASGAEDDGGRTLRYHRPLL
jgi:hypothetical protein